MGERWTLLIVQDRPRDPRGHGALLAGLPGLTANLSILRLEARGAAGLVERVPAPGDPGAEAHDRLTPTGRDLAPAIRAHADPRRRPDDLPVEPRPGQHLLPSGAPPSPPAAPPPP